MPTQIWTVKKLLLWTTGYFAQHGIPNPRLDAEVLLSHLLQKSRLQLYLDFDMPVFQEHLTPFRQLIRQRIARTPVSYLTNRKEFMSLDFYVDARVLIPRPETEHLVETVLNEEPVDAPPNLNREPVGTLSNLNQEPVDVPSNVNQEPVGALGKRALDLGTGSGVIAISLAVQRPGWNIVATDISEEALAVAQKNAETHHCTEQITLLHGDLFEPVDAQRFDWIICNPPYIKSIERDRLSADIRDCEPAIALFAGDDGLAVISRLIAEAPDYLAPNGKLIFEIGDTQAEEVCALIEAQPAYRTYELLKDYAQKERIVLASL